MCFTMCILAERLPAVHCRSLKRATANRLRAPQVLRALQALWLAWATVLLSPLPASAADELDLVTSPHVPSLRIPADLELHEVLREPVVANPLYLSFDERGRLWVVQYRQYPWPAGLRLVSRDAVWRNVYDPPFPPPPPHAANSPFRGRDRITIHEDTDGDGSFDRTKVFLDGLNFATAALKGRGGVFVMNPPYLLFYADRDSDDVPDGEAPRVLLSGFGIEDSHSIANSLRWGTDGWIYGTQGSTVSAAVVRHGPDNEVLAGEKPIRSLGQNVWRYHPESHVYEIFAEGGGNAFGVEIDSQGHLYSGHNGGDTRGFHYVQGGYYQKTFGKHGQLSNPYAFGYFPPMRHHAVERFTHAFAIYEADRLPQRYRGKLFGIAPHLHYVVHSEIMDDGSSRKTRDISKVIVPGDGERDAWFSPVDIQLGPDGALYIADWHAVQVAHYVAHQGQTNPDLGRVYRLQAPGALPPEKFDLGRLSSEQLVEQYLSHSNRWYRQQALRLLGDRKDESVVPLLERLIFENNGQLALEALWAVHLCGGFDEELALRALAHPSAPVRRWAVRLLGDRGSVSPTVADRWWHMAEQEADLETCSQLASTARRLPAEEALRVAFALLRRAELAGDPHLPLLIWWAVEAHADRHELMLGLFEDERNWLVAIRPGGATVPQNLMRRWATAGGQEELLACARLLELAPSRSHAEPVLQGFLRAVEGRSLPALPEPLLASLARFQGSFALVLDVRRSRAGAIERALAVVQDRRADRQDRLQLIAALGDVRAEPERVLPALLNVASDENDVALAGSALAAIQKLPRPAAGSEVLALYKELAPEVRPLAVSLLASRAEWTKLLLEAIDQGRMAKHEVAADAITRMRLHRQPEVAELLTRHFPEPGHSPEAFDQRIDVLAQLVSEGQGNPLIGQEIFHTKADCGRCHRMYDRGGEIGPDLTPYPRTNARAMLLAIVHPSAEIREGYESHTVLTTDGQVLSGFKLEQNDKLLVLQDGQGQRHAIARDEIDELSADRQSLMPEGLLDRLSDQELRDLFAFLATTTPPK